MNATVEEVAVLFSKCGILKEDDDGVRIKLYKSSFAIASFLCDEKSVTV